MPFGRVVATFKSKDDNNSLKSIEKSHQKSIKDVTFQLKKKMKNKNEISFMKEIQDKIGFW